MSEECEKEPSRAERLRLENRRKACMIEVGHEELCVDPSLPFLNIMGKKYTLLILGVIGNRSGGPNFNEILRDIPFSSSTIISKRLKELSDLNIISRENRDGRVTYSLTDSGKAIREAIILFIKVLAELSDANQ